MAGDFLNWLWTRQDYFWFLSGFVWLAAGGAWFFRGADRPAPAWIGWSAALGVLVSVVEFAILATPVQLRPRVPPSLGGDLALGLLVAVHAGGWWGCALRARGVSLRWLWALLPALAGAVVVRWALPVPADIALAAALLGAAVALATKPGAGFGGPLPLVLATLAGLGGTVGLLATASGESQRWAELSRLGTGSALLQLAAAVAVWHRLDRAGATEAASRQDRRFVALQVGWLAVGLAFASLIGWQARRSFENGILHRVQVAADLLDPAVFARALSEDFQIEGRRLWRDPSGAQLISAFSGHLQRTGAPAEVLLGRVRTANPDIAAVKVIALREGWLVTALIGDAAGPRRGRITLIGRVEPDELATWAEHRAEFAPPSLVGRSSYAQASAPLLTSEGRLIGRLEFTLTASTWLAAQTQTRLLAYGIVTLGLVLGTLAHAYRRRERERDYAQAEARAARATDHIKTTFLAKVSHELRTPLQGILGHVDLAASGTEVRRGNSMQAIRQSAELMSRLVNDLVDLGAAEGGVFRLVFQPVDVAELVRQTTESFRPSATDKGLALSCRIDPAMPAWIEADAQRLRQVVINLVSNAVKYTDRGGIIVELTVTTDPDGPPFVMLAVEDSGPGIPAADRARLFAPFSRLNATADREGTGLGLAVASAICRASGGVLRVEDGVGGGSRFVATWTLRAAQPPAAPAAPVPSSLRGQRVLVADDNAIVRDVFVSYLTECGATCALAGDGQAALERIASEPYDAVVLDLAMPRKTGLEVALAVRADPRRRGLRLIGVSAHAGAEEHARAVAAGMDRFLVKPVNLAALAAALGAVPAPAAAAGRGESAVIAGIRAAARRRFRAEATGQAARVAEAWRRLDWPELAAAAHYLRSSALIVQDGPLTDASGRLEQAAAAEDRAGAALAWERCAQALRPWTAPPSDSLSVENPSAENPTTTYKRNQDHAL